MWSWLKLSAVYCDQISKVSGATNIVNNYIEINCRFGYCYPLVDSIRYSLSIFIFKIAMHK